MRGMVAEDMRPGENAAAEFSELTTLEQQVQQLALRIDQMAAQMDQAVERIEQIWQHVQQG